MQHNAKSIRPFIGARDFETSRQFYKDLGFEESVVSNGMSFFRTDGLGFYLQDAYVKDWVDNTMLFLEVDDVERHWSELKALNLPARYENVRLTPIRREHWGKECFLHDPSGILDQEFWERAGGCQTWREMHASTDGEHQLNLLRRCTYSGRPFGEEDFVVRLERHFQRSWRRWSFEKAAAASAMG